MRFEWDEEKNRINQRKHKISFETAIQVLRILSCLKNTMLNTALMRIAIKLLAWWANYFVLCTRTEPNVMLIA